MVEGGHRRRRSAPWATTGSRLWLAVAIGALALVYSAAIRRDISFK